MNVQEQAAQRRMAMLTTAKQHLNGEIVPWLCEVLRSLVSDAERGVVVAVHQTPEQEGMHVSCLWVSQQRKFYEVVATCSYTDLSQVVQVESVQEVTNNFPIAARLPGRGASDGLLAVDVLTEIIESKTAG